MSLVAMVTAPALAVPALAAPATASVTISLDKPHAGYGASVTWTARAKDSGGSPVAGATLNVTLPSGAVATATTGADGSARRGFRAFEGGSVEVHDDAGGASAYTYLWVAPTLRINAPTRRARAYEAVDVAAWVTADVGVATVQRQRVGESRWTTVPEATFVNGRARVPLWAPSTGTWRFRLVTAMDRSSLRAAAVSNVVAMRVAGAAPAAVATLNAIRVRSGVRPVYWSAQANKMMALHTGWMARNRTICHCQKPGTPRYSKAGHEVAQSSLLGIEHGARSLKGYDVRAVWGLAGAPFHSVGMLSAGLSGVGIAVSRYGRTNASGVLMWDRTHDQALRRAVTMWPGPGAVLPKYLRTANPEDPDPLVSCGKRYRVGRSGVPLWASFGMDTVSVPYASRGYYPRVLRVRLVENGRTSVGVCVIRPDTYRGRNAGMTYNGRGLLGSENGIILVPSRALRAGARYTASITTQKGTVSWSFRVAR